MSDPSPIFSVASLLDCGGERHRLTVEEGELVAPAHPDAEGERALAALGGTACACVEALDAWARRRSDHRLLALLSRGPSDTLHPQHHGAGRGWVAYGPSSGRGRSARRAGSSSGSGSVVAANASGILRRLPARSDPNGAGGDSLLDDARLLAGLGRPLTARLLGSVTQRLVAQVELGEPGSERLLPALHSSLYGRAAESVAAWAGDDAVLAGIELDVAGPVSSSVEVDASPEGSPPRVRLRLPLLWVSQIWAYDLALVAGRLGVTLLAADDRSVTIQTVGWPAADIAAVTLGSADR